MNYVLLRIQQKRCPCPLAGAARDRYCPAIPLTAWAQLGRSSDRRTGNRLALFGVPALFYLCLTVVSPCRCRACPVWEGTGRAGSCSVRVGVEGALSWSASTYSGLCLFIIVLGTWEAWPDIDGTMRTRGCIPKLDSRTVPGCALDRRWAGAVGIWVLLCRVQSVTSTY